MTERIVNDTRDKLKQTLLSREHELLVQLGQVRVTLLGIAQAEALEQGKEIPTIPDHISELWESRGPERRPLGSLSSSLRDKPGVAAVPQFERPEY